MVLEQPNIHKQTKTTKPPDVNLTPYTKINSEWTMDLNVKHKTMKLLEKKKPLEKIQDLEFSDLTPKA